MAGFAHAAYYHTTLAAKYDLRRTHEARIQPISQQLHRARLDMQHAPSCFECLARVEVSQFCHGQRV